MHLKSSEIAIQETNPASASGRVEGRPILESRKWLFARIDGVGYPYTCCCICTRVTRYVSSVCSQCAKYTAFLERRSWFLRGSNAQPASGSKERGPERLSTAQETRRCSRSRDKFLCAPYHRSRSPTTTSSGIFI